VLTATADARSGLFTSVAFSPDGRLLAVAGDAGRVVIWEVAWINSELGRRGLGW